MENRRESDPQNQRSRTQDSEAAGSSRVTDRASLTYSEGSQPWGKTVSLEHVFAGPHGALVLGGSPENDHLSIASAHTVIMRKIGEVEEPVDFETAISCTGHGCFQRKLMLVCGFVYACCSLSTTTLSFVLPAAQYDFDLNSVDKGVLNTAPLWGMVVGSYVWGNFADSRGRRFVLFWALFIDAIASFLSSFCQKYIFFYVIRIFNGFGIIGATSIVFAYMGEFLTHVHRDKYLSRLELFWTLGIISLPVIGLAILPLDFEIGEKGKFVYDEWRAFVFACGIPSLLAAILILRMPESPRFLLIQGKLDMARKVLANMFSSNTGRARDEFPVKVLDEHPEADSYYFKKGKQSACFKRFTQVVFGILKQHRDLFSGRSCINILLTCYIDFCLISVYYTMMLWVPELLNREEKYFHEHQGDRPTLCEVSATQADDKPTNAKIPMETYIHTIITCLACLPTTFALLILVHYVSKKVLLCGIMISSAIPAVALAHVSTLPLTVATLSTLKSMTNLAEAILFCAVVEIFPITTRGTALSLTVTVGRIGSVIGNVVFGMMIDRQCLQLFYGMAAVLVSSGVVSLLLPKMKAGS